MKVQRLSMKFVFAFLFGTAPCFSQTIVKMQNGYGVMSSHNEMLIRDCESIQEVNTKRGDVYIIKKNGSFGIRVKTNDGYSTKGYFIYYTSTTTEMEDWSQINFQYDEIMPIESRNQEIDLLVRKNNLYGAINVLNEVTVPVKYDSIISTKGRVCLTLVNKNNKWAIVPNNLIGGYSSNLLNFEYDAVSLGNRKTDVVQLLNNKHFALAYYSNNSETIITPSIFDSVVSNNGFFIEAVKDDTTFFIYSDLKKAYQTDYITQLDITDKTVFYDILTSQRLYLNVDKGRYLVKPFFPYVYLVSQINGNISVIDLNLLDAHSAENQTNIQELMINNDSEEWYGYQFMLENKVEADFMNVGTIYRMNDYKAAFSYPIDPKKETLQLEIFEKDHMFMKISLLTLANGRTKTLGYFEFTEPGMAFSHYKPYDDTPQYACGGGGLKLMDFLWMGGR